MSGVKYSKVELKAERKAVREALGEIASLRRRVEALRERIQLIKEKIPKGVRKSFFNEMTEVNSWLEIKFPEYSEEMSSSQLRSIVEKLKVMESEGQDILKRLIDIKEVKIGKKAKSLLNQIELLKSTLKSMKILLNKWQPGEFEKFFKKIDSLDGMVNKGEFIKVENKIKDLENRLKKMDKNINSLQAQDKQRQWVLNALREVCKEKLGWGELGEPYLEDKNNPGSPICYEVDTYNGRIKFSLRLEGISVNSEITNEEDLCYNEFKNLSDKLRNYDIITEFKHENKIFSKPVDRARRALPQKTKVVRRKKK